MHTFVRDPHRQNQHSAGVDRSVFVDRSGRRRRAVMTVGVLTGVLLAAWLAMLGIGVATVLAGGPA